MKAASAQGLSQAQAMQAIQSSSYRDMLRQSLKAVDTISGKLDNGYTADARAALAGTQGDLEGMRGAASQMGRLGGLAEQDLDGTQIEQELTRQAQQELMLGRALSPEQQREATQAARGAYAARGMAMGNPAATAEILNRDAYGTAREAQRREFASGVNQLNVGNRMSRLGAAGQMYSNQGALSQGAAQTGMARSNQFMAVDPYGRALASNLPGQVMQGSLAMAGMAGDAITNNAQLAGTVAGFNANMQGSIYNSWLNNQAALKGAGMQAAASGQAGMMGMAGTGAAVAGTVAAGAIII